MSRPLSDYKFIKFISRCGVAVALLGLFLSGCTTAKIRVHSNPSGADVYARAVGGGRLQRIGQTPLFVDSGELGEKYGLAGALYVEIHKEGHRQDSFFVTEISKIDLNINRDLIPVRDLDQQLWLNGHIESLFEVRRLVEAKRFDEALRIIRKLREQTPYVATIHELEGGVYLLQGQHRDALDSFRLAMKYNPENPDTVKMVRHLERTLGVPREVDVTEVPLPQPAERQPSSKAAPRAEDAPSKEGASSKEVGQ